MEERKMEERKMEEREMKKKNKGGKRSLQMPPVLNKKK